MELSSAKWSLANLVYAAIAFVLGGSLLAIGAVADVSFLNVLGALTLVVGVLYLLTGLFGIAKELTSPEE